jgi:RES domain-containing protein
VNLSVVSLPPRRVWLRVADADWVDPLDPSYAATHGGRWNPPGSFPTLYLNADVATARAQLEHLLAGSPVRPEDLDDEAYVLVAAELPLRQTAADAVTVTGLTGLGLPATYPLDGRGVEVAHAVCQRVGVRIQDRGVRGVLCRSACTPDGSGRELAWFPADARSRARPVWDRPRPLGAWRNAERFEDLGLAPQPDPAAGSGPA